LQTAQIAEHSEGFCGFAVACQSDRFGMAKRLRIRRSLKRLRDTWQGDARQQQYSQNSPHRHDEPAYQPTSAL
jgi:hypothetical protein